MATITAIVAIVPMTFRNKIDLFKAIRGSGVVGVLWMVVAVTGRMVGKGFGKLVELVGKGLCELVDVGLGSWEIVVGDG